ncbi:hypothetical protein FNV43_RR20159 [Rhamnella rubrinervis]|uniref:NB-ARC domain-containing protein n=1 Tax=Rhamnella rubrinervis TaxID=2594499 RepID=A0A8K0DVF3_9ROSA|nr:hypothetical protein FNV43_RR20159 [Rhamnella rubrinervis]
MEIKLITGLKSMQGNSVYLGNALIGGRSKVREFQRLKERVSCRLESWKNRLLSKAGKVTLIQSVIQAIPTYTMSTFKVPTSVCKDLNAMVKRFWWGAKPGRQHYIALKACNELKKGVSPVWRGIICSRACLTSNARFQIGDGSSIRLTDPWVPGLLSSKVTFIEGVEMPTWLKVRDLKKIEEDEWDEEKLQTLFVADTVEAILRIKWPRVTCNDKLIWIDNKTGIFSVKENYLASFCGEFELNSIGFWEKLWKASLQERLKIFLWRMTVGIIPVNHVIFSRTGRGNLDCPLWGMEEESALHLFKRCEATNALAFMGVWGCRLEGWNITSIRELISFCVDPHRDVLINGLGKETLTIGLAYFSFARTSEAVTTGHAEGTKENWKPPPKNWLKANTDAVFKDGNAAFALVLRDEHGRVLFLASKIDRASNATEAELKALEVEAKSEPCCWDTRYLILLCKSLLKEMNWNLTWNARSSNTVADAAAKFTLSSKELGKLETAISTIKADEFVDEFHTEALRRRVTPGGKLRVFFSGSNQIAFRTKMGRVIKKIRGNLDEIRANRIFYLMERIEGTRGFSARMRDTHSFVRQEEVIGRNEDKMRIEKVQNHFELRIWVCVSDVFDLRLTIEKIIKSAAVDKGLGENLGMDQLQNRMREEIEGKRHLLVLDDVWTEDLKEWLSLKSLLMGGARGSRVLITTRSEKVARITHTTQPYYLKGLDKDMSWCLFKRIAFEQGQEPKNSSIVAIGMEILEKCKGVPLVIMTIGSLLYFKNPETEWLLFPKDHHIHVQMLIKLWMAQGFIKPLDQNQCLEDVGYEYFMDLFWRSFFHEVVMDECGTIRTCKMHDLMHDLTVKVAGTSSTILYQNADSFHGKVRHISFDADFDLSRIPNLQTLVVSGCEQLLSLPHDIRKLVCLRHLEIDGCPRLTHMPRGLGELTCLHTLNQFVLTENNSVWRHCGRFDELSNLNNLRGKFAFRILGHGKDMVLQSKLTNLKEKEHLQRLSVCWKYEYNNDEGNNVENDEMSLDGLQPHSNLKALKLPTLKELRLVWLGALEYVSNEFSDSLTASTTPFFSSLSVLHIIDCNKLKGWWRRRKDTDDKVYQQQPPFPCLSYLNICNCPNLTALPMFPYLQKSRLKNTSFKPLQKTIGMASESTDAAPPSTSSHPSSSFHALSKLKDLWIPNIRDVEFLPERIGHLTSLQSLVISGCPNLVSLSERIGTLSSLGSRAISQCFNLTSLPEGLGNLSLLRSLSISECFNLISLPEKIRNLSSLRTLHI